MTESAELEKGGSRRYPRQAVDWERVQNLLGNDELAVRKPLVGGACNTNYYLKTVSDREYVYRKYSRGSPLKDFQAMKLVEEEIPVPRILESGEDWALMPFIRGVPVSAGSTALTDVGRCLGVMSRIVFEKMGDLVEDGSIEPLPFDGFIGFFDQELSKRELQSWLSKPLVGRLRRFIEEHADLYRAFDAETSLVHGDFNPGNILVDADRVVGVLDWEFSMSGSPMIDTGNLLRHLGDDAKPALKAGMLNAGMSVPDNWEHQSRLADLASHIEFLSSGHDARFKERCVKRIVALL